MKKHTAILAGLLITFSYAMPTLTLAQTPPVQIQFGSANANMLQQLATGEINAGNAAQDLATRAGIDLGEAQTIIDNFEAIQNLDFESAADVLDSLTNGQISAGIAEALSELPDLGDITDISEISDIIDSIEVVRELEDLISNFGSQAAIQQITQIAELVGGTEALQNLVSSGISQVVSALPPSLVSALGGEASITEALTNAIGLTITLTPVSTGDPGICGGPCGTQNRGPMTPRGRTASCSFSCTGSQCEGTIRSNHNRIRTHVTDEFEAHRQWLIDIFWRDHILPALTMMSVQFSAVATQQTNAIGSFFDAKHQLETQRLLQKLSGDAYKDYTPSEGICEVGTNIRSLASSERKTDTAHIAIANRQVSRNVLGLNTVSTSVLSDKGARLAQFVQTYCDQSNNSNGLRYLCRTGSPEPERLNKDINYNKTFSAPLTIDMDVTQTGTDMTAQEEDIFALSANLYAHNVLPNFASRRLADGEGKPREEAYDYMNFRSVVAKRSVAMHNFSAIVASKTSGSDEAAPFLKRVVTEMGVPNEEVEFILGEAPSYHAQMEVLTKKLYQNPTFYTELYDKPTNVRRKAVMLRAINLMQERDIYDSLLRSEATLAVTLETMLDDEQERVKTRLLSAPAVSTETNMVAR